MNLGSEFESSVHSKKLMLYKLFQLPPTNQGLLTVSSSHPVGLQPPSSQNSVNYFKIHWCMQHSLQWLNHSFFNLVSVEQEFLRLSNVLCLKIQVINEWVVKSLLFLPYWFWNNWELEWSVKHDQHCLVIGDTALRTQLVRPQARSIPLYF